MTPLSGRRGQQAPSVSWTSDRPTWALAFSNRTPPPRFATFRELSDWYADQAMRFGADGLTRGDQMLAEMYAQLADRQAAFSEDALAAARRAGGIEARSVARPPSRRAR